MYLFEGTSSTLGKHCLLLSMYLQVLFDERTNAIAAHGYQDILKAGVGSTEHAVICNTGIDIRMCYLEGENLPKEPTRVMPTNQFAALAPTWRIPFAMVYSIEWNVKVKDFGKVADMDIPKLTWYYEDEHRQV